MIDLCCYSTFRCFEPLEEYRRACPQILIVCRGAHIHPVPLPSKTPPSIRTEIFELLQSLDQDLPDLTARRFLRHPITQAYLRKRFPYINSPCLADLHISLTNRSHINMYISQVQERCFPFGTGWRGKWHKLTLVPLGTDSPIWRTLSFKGHSRWVAETRMSICSICGRNSKWSFVCSRWRWSRWMSGSTPYNHLYEQIKQSAVTRSPILTKRHCLQTSYRISRIWDWGLRPKFTNRYDIVWFCMC